MSAKGAIYSFCPANCLLDWWVGLGSYGWGWRSWSPFECVGMNVWVWCEYVCVSMMGTLVCACACICVCIHDRHISLSMCFLYIGKTPPTLWAHARLKYVVIQWRATCGWMWSSLLVTLHYVTTHCNTLHTPQHTQRKRRATCGCTPSVCLLMTLQHTATHCNPLQHTATRCDTLQHNATHTGLEYVRWSDGQHAAIREAGLH